MCKARLRVATRGTMGMALHAPCAPMKSSLRVSFKAQSCGVLSVGSRHCPWYLQVGRSCSSSFSIGRPLLPSTRANLKRKAAYVAPVAAAAASTTTVTESNERFRLNNLSPQKGARRQEKRKGRGYGAGQVLPKHLHLPVQTQADQQFQTAKTVLCVGRYLWFWYERTESQIWKWGPTRI